MNHEFTRLSESIDAMDKEYEELLKSLAGRTYSEKRKKILVYESDAKEAIKIKEILNGFGLYRILVKTDVSNWEADIKAIMPKVILLDMFMNSKSGYEVLREISLHPIYRMIPVIVISHRSGLAEIAWAKKCGAADVVPKPIKSPADLFNTLTHTIKHSQLNKLDLHL